jgi:hypothetical protein
MILHLHHCCFALCLYVDCWRILGDRTKRDIQRACINTLEIMQKIVFVSYIFASNLSLLEILFSALNVFSAQTHCVQPSTQIPTFCAESCLEAAEAP